MRLSHRDFDLLQRALVELYEFRDTAEFRRALPGIFFKLVPSDHFGIANYEPRPTAGTMKLVDWVESEPRLKPWVIPLWEERLPQHPFSQYFSDGGEMTTLMFSDFLTTTQLRNSQIWELVCEVLGYDRCVSFPTANPRGLSALALGRRGKHFTERDRLIMNLVRPHFDRAQKNAELATARAPANARPLADFGLLPREIEVARWVAQGKTNPEIAMILRLSPRTVEKHMERILAKLGVENRAAAAVLICRSACPDSRS